MAKRKDKKSPIYCHGVGSTKERQHQNGGILIEVIHEKNDGKVYIKRHKSTFECPVDHYFHKGKLNASEHEAAMIFRRDYQRAVLKIKTDDYSAGSHGDKEMPMLVLLDSEKRIKQAYAVLSPAQRNLIIKVCGCDEWVGDTYRFETFHRGLAQLVKLWRLS